MITIYTPIGSVMTYSELEIAVIADMSDHGFDHNEEEDIEAYWKERLPE